MKANGINRNGLLTINAKLKLLLTLKEKLKHLEEVCYGDLRSDEEIAEENGNLKDELADMLYGILN